VENDSYYVPAAPDITSEKGGKYRWHGVRSSPDEPFDPAKGPLAAYLADGKVKQCPEKVNFIKHQQWSVNFEQGCGGYGYNKTYLGSRHWQKGIGYQEADKKTTSVSEVRRPSETLMFADCAMSMQKNSYIETSFAWQPFVVWRGTQMDIYQSPSIHFRHRGRANVGWADGHIDSRQMANFDASNVYGVDSAAMKLGWFEPVDNTPFDLE